MMCKWPNGDVRKVMVVAVTEDMAKIIWNERHSPILGQGCVVGLDDEVPMGWLNKEVKV